MPIFRRRSDPCPSPEVLEVAARSGTLDAALGQHLTKCDRCRKAFAGMKADLEIANTLRAAASSPEIQRADRDHIVELCHRAVAEPRVVDPA
jgi:anti-sigma factor ChrR (cupin superfamily)